MAMVSFPGVSPDGTFTMKACSGIMEGDLFYLLVALGGGRIRGGGLGVRGLYGVVGRCQMKGKRRRRNRNPRATAGKGKRRGAAPGASGVRFA